MTPGSLEKRRKMRFWIRCSNPDCENKIKVDPLEPQQPRGITCDVCNATFSFVNSDLQEGLDDALRRATPHY